MNELLDEMISLEDDFSNIDIRFTPQEYKVAALRLKRLRNFFNEKTYCKDTIETLLNN